MITTEYQRNLHEMVTNKGVVKTNVYEEYNTRTRIKVKQVQKDDNTPINLH